MAEINLSYDWQGPDRGSAFIWWSYFPVLLEQKWMLLPLLPLLATISILLPWWKLFHNDPPLIVLTEESHCTFPFQCTTISTLLNLEENFKLQKHSHLLQFYHQMVFYFVMLLACMWCKNANVYNLYFYLATVVNYAEGLDQLSLLSRP
jgi:hypothetical protein